MSISEGAPRLPRLSHLCPRFVPSLSQVCPTAPWDREITENKRFTADFSSCPAFFQKNFSIPQLARERHRGYRFYPSKRLFRKVSLRTSFRFFHMWRTAGVASHHAKNLSEPSLSKIMNGRYTTVGGSITYVAHLVKRFVYATSRLLKL